MAETLTTAGYVKGTQIALSAAVCVFLLSGCGANMPSVVEKRPSPLAAPPEISDIDPTHRDAGQILAIQSGIAERRPTPEADHTLQTAEAAPVTSTPPPVQAASSNVQPQAEPKSDGNRITSVAVPNVSGAPGAGNKELTAAMRDVLRKAGWPVRSVPAADALTIRGKVQVGKSVQGQQQVVLAWEVIDPAGKVIGVIKQANKVPAGSIDNGFGENAAHAAQGAASGIFNLISDVKKKHG